MISSIAMAFDVYRNKPYIDYIKHNVKDKVVVDCGSGSGIWTWISLYYGAKYVYCIDIHEPTLEHLNLLYNDNPKVSVKKLNLFTDTLPSGDIYIQELFGVNPFDEAIVNFFKNCSKQQISNVFPHELTLFSISEPTLNYLNNIYDYSLLEVSNKSFIDHLANKYGQPFNVNKWHHLFRNSNLSYQSKTKIWCGSLFDISSLLDIKFDGDAIIWEAGSEDYKVYLDNPYYNSWKGSYVGIKEFKHTLINYLKLDNTSALNYNYTLKKRGMNLKQYNNS